MEMQKACRRRAYGAAATANRIYQSSSDIKVITHLRIGGSGLMSQVC